MNMSFFKRLIVTLSIISTASMEVNAQSNEYLLAYKEQNVEQGLALAKIYFNLPAKQQQQTQNYMSQMYEKSYLQYSEELVNDPFYDAKTSSCAARGLERWAVYEYTKWQYKELNRALRTGDITPKVFALYMPLVHGLMQLPQFQGVVYRAAKTAYEANLKTTTIGSTIEFKGFTSTSTNTNYFDDPSYDVHLIIKTKTGRSVKDCSNAPGEDEVLLFPNSKFLIRAKEKAGSQIILYLDEI